MNFRDKKNDINPSTTEINKSGFSDLKLSLEDQDIIVGILRLARMPGSLDELMHDALCLITSGTQFNSAHKASIHLSVDENKPLRLSAKMGFHNEIPVSCSKLPLAKCLCGRENNKENIIYIERNSNSNGRIWKCQADHSHYCIPIRDEKRLLGVVNIFTEERAIGNDRYERYFTILSEAIASIIICKQIDATLPINTYQFELNPKKQKKHTKNEYVSSPCAGAASRKNCHILSRVSEEEHAIGELLRIASKSSTLDQYLKSSIQMLKNSVRWIGSLPKCSVFLVDDSDDETLRMIASYGISEQVENRCAQVSFGECFCGNAASSKKSIFTAVGCESNLQLTTPPGLEHSHFSVPIMLNDTTLGVLVVYLPVQYERSENDESFLVRVADVLSMGITRRRHEKEIEYLKCYDRQTGLKNRSQLLSDLEKTISINKRLRHVGVILFIGLINFKKINDFLGSAAGDILLVKIADRLNSLRGKSDSVARVGGTELIMLLPDEGDNYEDAEVHAQKMAERIIHSIASEYIIDGKKIIVELNIGITLFDGNDDTACDLLQQSSTAMRRAKEEAPNLTCFFHPSMREIIHSRFSIEQDLRYALDEQLFQLYFQPQFDASGQLVGAEALLRCFDAKGQFLPTDICVDVAENTGLILQIGEWVLCEACALLENWSQHGIASSLNHLCVNISPKQFYQKNFVSLVKSILYEYDINPRQLVLEITEGVLIDSKLKAIEIMSSLKLLGVGFAIDDFGTGYSSLSYLTQLPLDILKIDRAFVTRVMDDPKQAVIVETLITMANKLGFETIAEGVETKQELDFLLDKGNVCFQGFYFSKPISVDGFTKMLH